MPAAMGENTGSRVDAGMMETATAEAWNNTGDDWICGQFDGLVRVIFGRRSPLLYAFCWRESLRTATGLYVSAAEAGTDDDERARISINSDDVFIHSLTRPATLGWTSCRSRHIAAWMRRA